jgi:hypothetical protein
VERTDTTSAQWQGQVRTSGKISVAVKADSTLNFSEHIQIAPRTGGPWVTPVNWIATPTPFTDWSPGPVLGENVNLGSPAGNLDMLTGAIDWWTIEDNGPNHGYAWVLSTTTSHEGQGGGGRLGHQGRLSQHAMNPNTCIDVRHLLARAVVQIADTADARRDFVDMAERSARQTMSHKYVFGHHTTNSWIIVGDSTQWVLHQHSDPQDHGAVISDPQPSICDWSSY